MLTKPALLVIRTCVGYPDTQGTPPAINSQHSQFRWLNWALKIINNRLFAAAELAIVIICWVSFFPTEVHTAPHTVICQSVFLCLNFHPLLTTIPAISEYLTSVIFLISLHVIGSKHIFLWRISLPSKWALWLLCRVLCLSIIYKLLSCPSSRNAKHGIKESNKARTKARFPWQHNLYAFLMRCLICLTEQWQLPVEEKNKLYLN